MGGGGAKACAKPKGSWGARIRRPGRSHGYANRLRGAWSRGLNSNLNTNNAKDSCDIEETANENGGAHRRRVKPAYRGRSGGKKRQAIKDQKVRSTSRGGTCEYEKSRCETDLMRGEVGKEEADYAKLNLL